MSLPLSTSRVSKAVTLQASRDVLDRAELLCLKWNRRLCRRASLQSATDKGSSSICVWNLPVGGKILFQCLMGPRRGIHFLVPSCSGKCVKISLMSCSSSQEPKGDPREFRHLQKWWLGSRNVTASDRDCGGKVTLQQLCWACQEGPNPSAPRQFLSWPCSPSAPRAPPHCRARGAGMSLAWGKHYSSTTSSPLCYQHYSHTEYNTWHCTSCWGGN